MGSSLVAPRVSRLRRSRHGWGVLRESWSRRLGTENGPRTRKQGGECREEAPSESEEDRDDDRTVERLAELAAADQLLVDVAEHRRADRRPEERSQPAERDEHEHTNVDLVEDV